MSFAAVVVSYNRIELLKKCLYALENQTRLLDEIIVVDNGSTDRSADYVEQDHPNITLFRTGKNLGGAGGFAWGVEIALAHKHEAVWVMDDDAEPELDAFEPLAQCLESTNPRPVFIASLVTAGRGTFNKGNPPVISPNAEYQVRANHLGGIAIDTATFVGVLINLQTAAQTHLPLKDFFIWMDDSEYTYRLSRAGMALCLTASQVNHPKNQSNRASMGARLFYYIRNWLWFIRERDSLVSRDLLDATGIAIHSLKQFVVAEDKKQWLSSVSRGWWQGLFRRPRHQQPGELLATLTPAQRAAIGC